MSSQTSTKEPIMIYDGDCAFCSSSIRTLQRAIPRAPKMVPYQFIDPDQFGLTLMDCETAVQYVDKVGVAHAGHDAYRHMLKDLGGLYKLFGLLMRTPGYFFLANRIYAFVAKNRHRMPGGTPTCSLENRPKSP